MKRKPSKRSWTTDKSKINFYTANHTDHKQTIIEGIRPDGKPWKLICDWNIAPFIKLLNNTGIRTLWSCQGDACGTNTAYIVINTAHLSRKAVAHADELIRKYWHDRFITTEVTCEGNLAFYAYTYHQLMEMDKKHLARSRDYTV